ncbi:DYHC protein, partial [Bucorvus abyssinicus]|nr:DYHC protein [Bucorvus abyssinicus]
MEELSNTLFYDSVLHSWTRHAYPSLLSLGAWYADLLLRVQVSTSRRKGNAQGASRSRRRPGIPSSSIQSLAGSFVSINLSSLKYLKGPVTPSMRAEL